MEFAPYIEGLSHATKDDLVAENRKLRARIAKFEQLAKDMAEKFDGIREQFPKNAASVIPLLCDEATSRYREVCGGEKSPQSIG